MYSLNTLVSNVLAQIWSYGTSKHDYYKEMGQKSQVVNMARTPDFMFTHLFAEPLGVST